MISDERLKAINEYFVGVDNPYMQDFKEVAAELLRWRELGREMTKMFPIPLFSQRPLIKRASEILGEKNPLNP